MKSAKRPFTCLSHLTLLITPNINSIHEIFAVSLSVFLWWRYEPWWRLSPQWHRFAKK